MYKLSLGRGSFMPYVESVKHSFLDTAKEFLSEVPELASQFLLQLKINEAEDAKIKGILKDSEKSFATKANDLDKMARNLDKLALNSLVNKSIPPRPETILAIRLLSSVLEFADVVEKTTQLSSLEEFNMKVEDFNLETVESVLKTAKKLTPYSEDESILIRAKIKALEEYKKLYIKLDGERESLLRGSEDLIVELAPSVSSSVISMQGVHETFFGLRAQFNLSSGTIVENNKESQPLAKLDSYVNNLVQIKPENIVNEKKDAIAQEVMQIRIDMKEVNKIDNTIKKLKFDLMKAQLLESHAGQELSRHRSKNPAKAGFIQEYLDKIKVTKSLDELYEAVQADPEKTIENKKIRMRDNIGTGLYRLQIWKNNGGKSTTDTLAIRLNIELNRLVQDAKAKANAEANATAIEHREASVLSISNSKSLMMPFAKHDQASATNASTTAKSDKSEDKKESGPQQSWMRSPSPALAESIDPNDGMFAMDFGI